jgi:hypothetical protein
MPAEKTHSKAQIRAILSDPNTFATTLIVAIIDFYGTEFTNWDPATILMETEEDFGFQWPQANFDRLMAGMALLKTDSFYKNPSDFVELCNILSGAPATPGIFSPADTTECAWGITEALLLAPPHDAEPFSEEVRAYIGRACEEEGIINPPDILKIGIPSGALKIKVSNNYSDDPELYGAIWQEEKSKTDDINDLVKMRLMLLVQQLSTLPLVTVQQRRLQNGCCIH